MECNCSILILLLWDYLPLALIQGGPTSGLQASCGPEGTVWPTGSHQLLLPLSLLLQQQLPLPPPQLQFLLHAHMGREQGRVAQPKCQGRQ